MLWQLVKAYGYVRGALCRAAMHYLQVELQKSFSWAGMEHMTLAVAAPLMTKLSTLQRLCMWRMLLTEQALRALSRHLPQSLEHLAFVDCVFDTEDTLAGLLAWVGNVPCIGLCTDQRRQLVWETPTAANGGAAHQLLSQRVLKRMCAWSMQQPVSLELRGVGEEALDLLSIVKRYPHISFVMA